MEYSTAKIYKHFKIKGVKRLAKHLRALMSKKAVSEVQK